jgi:two-component system NtrC family sensor kinase
MLLIAAAALVPLGILGIGATEVSTQRMTDKVANSQARAADELAVLVVTGLTRESRIFAQQVEAFDLKSFDDRTMEGFQRLVFRQSGTVNIVSVVNVKGVEALPSVFLSSLTEGQFPGKEVVGTARISEFRANIPTEGMKRELTRWKDAVDDARPVVIGKPYTPADRDAPVVPIAIPVAPESELFLVVELALDAAAEHFVRLAEGGLDVELMDAVGDPTIREGVGLVERSHFRVFQPGSSCSDVRYTTQEGEKVVGACAPVAGTGWMVVVAEPMSSITHASDEIRNRTAYIGGLAALLSVLFGLMFSTQVSERVTRLKDAALAVAEGDLGRSVGLDGSKEIRDLSRAFNFMSRRLAHNQNEIEGQREAIGAFNLELQRRLDQQELELTEANQRLVQSARLAAVGEMGAGLAHELNNPLAGILGMVQVLQMKQQDESGPLKDVEDLAQRCRVIVEQLLRFSRHGTEAKPLDKADWVALDLGELLDDVKSIVAGPFRVAGVELTTDVSGNLSIRGDRESINQALVQLFTSIRTACGEGGGVNIRGFIQRKHAVLEITANNEMLNISEDDWMASGMGFWLAKQVVAEHGGRLQEADNSATSVAVWTLQIPVTT